MAENEKGLTRGGGVGGHEGESSNNIAPEGSAERRPLPRSNPLAGQRPRNPFMDEESQARRDRELRSSDGRWAAAGSPRTC